MYGCESWTIKKAECQRIDVFELWCWRRLLRVLWTARRSNQSILKKINSEYSLEGLMLMLKLQYFGHLMWRANSLEKTLMLGKTEGRRREWQRMRWLDGIINPMDVSLSKVQEMVKNRKAWCAIIHGVAKSQTLLSKWKTTKTCKFWLLFCCSQNSLSWSLIIIICLNVALFRFNLFGFFGPHTFRGPFVSPYSGRVQPLWL